MKSNTELTAEARYIARVTCRLIELVLIEVEALDRAGRRVMLVDWRTGEKRAQLQENGLTRD